MIFYNIHVVDWFCVHTIHKTAVKNQQHAWPRFDWSWTQLQCIQHLTFRSKPTTAIRVGRRSLILPGHPAAARQASPREPYRPSQPNARCRSTTKSSSASSANQCEKPTMSRKRKHRRCALSTVIKYQRFVIMKRVLLSCTSVNIEGKNGPIWLAKTTVHLVKTSVLPKPEKKWLFQTITYL